MDHQPLDEEQWWKMKTADKPQKARDFSLHRKEHIETCPTCNQEVKKTQKKTDALCQ